MAAHAAYVLDTVLSEPLTPARLQLQKHFGSAAFSETDYELLLTDLIAKVPASEKAGLELQRSFATLALAKDPAFGFKRVELDTEAKRLLWSSVAGYIAKNEKTQGKLDDHAAWQKIKYSSWAQNERMKIHSHLFFSTQDKKAQVGWGNPGSSFYYSPSTNYINLDLWDVLRDPNYLLTFYHEEGHRLFSAEYPKTITDLRTKLLDMEELQNQRPLTQDEIDKVNELAARREALHTLWNCLEDNAVDFYSVKRYEHERRPDPLGAFLSRETVTRGFGTAAQNYDEHALAMAGNGPAAITPSVKQRWSNLQIACYSSLAMRQEHKFQPTTLEGHRRIGMEPEWLEAKGENPGDPPLKGMDALRLLQSYARRIGNAQPDPSLYSNSAALKAEALRCVALRNTLIEEVFERFAEPLLTELIKERDTSKDAQPDENGKMEIPVPPDTPGEEQDPKPKEGKGKPSPGSPDASPNDTPPKLEDLEAQDAVQNPAPPADEPASDKPTPDKPSPPKAPNPSPAPPQDSPKDEKQENPNAPPAPPPPPNQNKPGAALDKKQEADALRQAGTRNEYDNMVAQHDAVIDEMVPLLEQIQRQQIELIQIPGKLDIAPGSAPADQRAIERQMIAEETERLTADDHKIFPQNTTTPRPPQMTIAVLGDGSGSVELYRKDIVGTACALNEAVDIVNGRSKNPAINYHFSLWGAKEAVTIAAPGMDKEDVAKGIVGAKDCTLNSSNLAPALQEFLIQATTPARERGRAVSTNASRVGMSHLMIVSDGDLDDLENTKKALRAIMKNCPNVTFDAVVIPRSQHLFLNMAGFGPVDENDPIIRDILNRKSNMELLVDSLSKEFEGRLSITKTSPDAIQNGMVRALSTRMETCMRQPCLTYPAAQRQFKTALEEITTERKL